MVIAQDTKVSIYAPFASVWMDGIEDEGQLLLFRLTMLEMLCPLRL